MKKTILSLIASIICLNLAFGQDTYIVQQIKGTIKRSGVSIKIGDRLKSTDIITFGPGAIMLVSSDQYGKDYIKPTASTGVSESASTLMDLLPTSRRASTKGILSNQPAFETNFGSGKFRVYGKYAFQASAGSYPQTDASFFYFMFTYEGKTINKQLSSEGEYCMMDFKSVYAIEGKKLTNDQITICDLYYYNPSEKRNEKLVSFKPEFIDVSVDKEEIQELVEMMQAAKACYKDIWTSTRNYLERKYGKVEHDNVEEFLKVEFKVIKDLENCTNK